MSKADENQNSPDQDIYSVRKKVIFPQNLKYFCPAFPPRRGFLTINLSGEEYKMFAIAPGNTFELVYPKTTQDGWIRTCVQQYIGPDLIMISDNCYTDYIKLI